MDKVKVGILGATGMVGQRFIQLLAAHPWFEVAEVAASERSAGKKYGVAMEGRWKLSTAIPESMRDLELKECKLGLGCSLVFSALDADIAGPIEQDFARAGYIVSSNSRNHRMEPDVPLLIPEVNPEHLELIPVQKNRRGWKGMIVTNPNCSTIHMVMVLKPLMRFGLSQLLVTTMQALSGAGYPGVASLDILDNVIPFIGGEEEKIQTETLKLLGSFGDGRITLAPIVVSAHCNRVHVGDGHTECVSVRLDSKPSLADVEEAMRQFNPLKGMGLPSSPGRPIVLRSEPNRPQPRMDRELEKGMASIVGRIRECPLLGYKFVVLGHNTIRGAAGAAILNAELMVKKGYVQRH